MKQREIWKISLVRYELNSCCFRRCLIFSFYNALCKAVAENCSMLNRAVALFGSGSAGLGPTIGAEIKKARPCVILNDDCIGVLPLKIIAPLTAFKEKYEIVPWMVKILPDRINNLTKVSVIDTFQIRSVSKDRLIKQIGIISNADLQKALLAIKLLFGVK